MRFTFKPLPSFSLREIIPWHKPAWQAHLTLNEFLNTLHVGQYTSILPEVSS